MPRSPRPIFRPMLVHSRWFQFVRVRSPRRLMPRDPQRRTLADPPERVQEPCQVGVAGSNPVVRSIPRVLTCFFSRLPNLAVAILPMSCPWLAHDPGRMVTLRRAREALHGEEGG